jgi:transcriptional regulator with XRE-family HTH domain
MNGNIPKLIIAELKQAKATKEELADFAGIALVRLEEIIKGERKPSVAEGIALAQFFDLEPMLFLGGK